MRFTLAVAASLLALADARITGISVPSTIKPGQGFNVIIESETYSQSIYDAAIVFGYARGEGFPGGLGSVVEEFTLGKDASNQPDVISRSTKIPADTPKGTGVFSASLLSLTGAAGTPTLDNFNVTVYIGDTTSTTYVSSQEV